MSPEILSTLIGSLIGSAAFWLAYRVTIYNRALHRSGRIYLLLAMILPLGVPPIQRLLAGATESYTVSYQLPGQLVGQISPAAAAPGLSLSVVAALGYTAVAAALLVRQLAGAIGLLQALRRATSAMQRGVRVYTNTGYGPGSIGRAVFFPEAEVTPEILAHEVGHIRLGHRYDLVFANLLCCLCWINPFAWLLRRELLLVHEFEADAVAARHGIRPEQYAKLLLRQSFGLKATVFSHSFFHHPIKQRIVMLFAKESSPTGRTVRQLTAGLTLVAISASLLFVQCRQETAAPEVVASGDVFKYVDQMPEFNGELNDYLVKSLQYPDAARAAGTQGRSVVQFVVGRDGAVSQPKIVKSSGSPLLDNEAMRVVRNMPAWKPGIHKGEEVNVLFTLPITFMLDDAPAKATSFRDVETRKLPDNEGHFVCIDQPVNADAQIVNGTFSSPGLQDEAPITVGFSLE